MKRDPAILQGLAAVRFFCELVYTYESSTDKLKDLPLGSRKPHNWDVSYINKKIKEYDSNDELSAKAMIHILGENCQEKTLLSRLAYHLSHNLPFQYNNKMEKHLGSRFPWVSEIARTPPKLKITNKELSLGDTNWWFYHYDDFGLSVDKEKSTGIVRGIVRFEQFGKVTLESISHVDNVLEFYHGTYESYDSGKYLIFRLRTAGENGRNLHIMMSIGDGDHFSLAIGIYHNINESHYSGTILMEELKSSKKGRKKAEFLLKDTPAYNDLPEYVRDFFSERSNNLIKAPVGKTNVAEFKKWLSDKKSTRRKTQS